MYNSREDMIYTQVAAHINISGIPLSHVQHA